jgi:hypothetical protein
MVLVQGCIAGIVLDKYEVTVANEVKYVLPGQNVTLEYTIDNKKNNGEVPRLLRFYVQESPSRMSVLLRLVRQDDGSYESTVENVGARLARYKDRVSSASIEYRVPNVQVQLTNLQPKDFTKYILKVSGPGKQYDELNQKAIQLKKAVPPKIDGSSFFPSHIMKKGSTTDFKCSASGVPTPKVQWMLKGSNKQLSSGLNDTTLRITNAKSEDVENYECEASNSGGVDTKVMSLTVSYIMYTEEEGKKKSELHEVRRGHKQLTATCNIDGYPKVNYRWTNPKNLTIWTTRVLDLAGNNGVELFGTYTCEAENEFGTLKYVVQVNEVGTKKKKSTEPQEGDADNRDVDVVVVDGNRSPVTGSSQSSSTTNTNNTLLTLLHILLLSIFLLT